MRTLSEPDRTNPLTVGLIPARWQSSRFEGKPLALINGVPMIKRVYDQATQCEELDTVVVLTDDKRINDYCVTNEIRCIVIEDDCKTGTDRCAKALELIDGDIFVNIQGDEPLIDPNAIDELIRNHDKEIGVSNAYVVLDEEDLWHKLNDNNVVKCVIDMYDNVIYYSRYGIPYQKGAEPYFYQQLGLYVFNRETLEQFANMPIGPVEKAEGIEMLRFLENSWTVNMVQVQDEGLSVDTQRDLRKVENYLNAQIN